MKILSIIIPSYNAEKYLKQCIDSINSSSFLEEHCELVIVNDGSTDLTSYIAHEYERQYSNVVVIDKENGGHGSGINVGSSVAKGKYFKIIDADDWVITENFEKFVHRLLTVDIDIVAHYQNNVYENIGENIIKPVESIEVGKEYLLKDMPSDTLLGLSNICFKTSKYLKNNIKVDENCFYVDMEYILYPLRYMKSLIVFDDVVYCYRLGNSTQSVNYGSMFKNRFQHLKVIKSLLNYYDEMREEETPKNILAYIENVVSAMVRAHYYLYFMNKILNSELDELKEFDKFISHYKNIYVKSGKSKSIKLMRVLNFSGYKILMKVYRKL